MYSTIFFLLVTVCVVNASVITVNVFDDDDPEIELLSSPKSCNPHECDQRCRRLKFPGGACVNGRCKCDNFLNTEDEESTLPEVLVSLEGSPKDCNPQECDQRCRRLKFPGGACVNGRCKCDNFLNAEDVVSDEEPSLPKVLVSLADEPETQAASSPKDCNPQECDQRCRRLKFHGGACVNGRCKCDNFLNSKDDVSDEESSHPEVLVSVEDAPEIKLLSSPKDCNPQECDQRCRRLKFPGGACVNGRCKCDLFGSAEDDTEAELAEKPRRCRDRVCDTVCRALNNTSGTCVDGRCKCTKSVAAEDDPEATVAANPRRCRDKVCNTVCRALNNTSGACFDGRCKCTKSVVAEENPEPDVLKIKWRCSNKACRLLCRSGSFKQGKCSGRHCKCSQFSAIDTLTEPAASLRSCNSIACDDQCRRNGWQSGVCIKGQCKCDYFL